MKTAPIVLLLATLLNTPCLAADSPRVHFLMFSKADAESLGQIDHLSVTVDCSWIAALKNVPELYNVKMGYDLPTQNAFEARPRLGAAAVTLASWSGVIGVRIPAGADARSCFAVSVIAEGRSGVTRTWSGKQLGLADEG